MSLFNFVDNLKSLLEIGHSILKDSKCINVTDENDRPIISYTFDEFTTYQSAQVEPYVELVDRFCPNLIRIRYIFMY